jgi:tripartite-type tricarboxylate transporter receptor subunit TctC
MMFDARTLRRAQPLVAPPMTDRGVCAIRPGGNVASSAIRAFETRGLRTRCGWIAGAVAAALVVTTAPVRSQSYPSQPITITVTFPPGGSADLTTRIIGEKLSAKLGQPVVVENRAGGGGEIGLVSIVRAPPDGYRLLSTTSGSIALAGSLRQVSYDAEADLMPVSMLVKVPTAIAVNASLPIHTVADLVKLSKERPDGLSYGNPGVGSFMHLAGEIFRLKTGANLVSVPYRGTAATALAVKTGETQMGVADLTSLLPFASEGSIRILGLVDSSRTSVAPEIPTIAEGGVPEFGADGWVGIFAPRGTSPRTVALLNATINEALAMPEVRQRILTFGLDPWILSPQAMNEFVKEEIARWKILIREAGVKVQ